MLIDLSQAVGAYLHEVFVAKFQWIVLLGYAAQIMFTMRFVVQSGHSLWTIAASSLAAALWPSPIFAETSSTRRGAAAPTMVPASPIDDGAKTWSS